MAHFSIWIPNGKGTEAEALRSVGLDDLLSTGGGDLSPAHSVSIGGQGGPTTGEGMLLQWLDPTLPPDRQCRLGYHPSSQDWQPLPAFKLDGVLKPKGTAWIGVEKDRPVTPADLLRRSEVRGRARYDGDAVVLGDKNAWLMPSQFRLPMELAIDPDTGEDKKLVVQSELPVWERMQAALLSAKVTVLAAHEEAWKQLPESERSGLEPPEVLPAGAQEWSEWEVRDYCIWGLSLNYRITKLVAAALHLFNEKTVWPAFYAMTDVADLIKLEMALKKTQERWELWRAKTSGSPGSSGGEKAA